MSTLKLNELVRMNGNRNLSSSSAKELLHWSQSQLSLWECDKLAEKSPVSSFDQDLHLCSNISSINNCLTAFLLVLLHVFLSQPRFSVFR